MCLAPSLSFLLSSDVQATSSLKLFHIKFQIYFSSPPFFLTRVTQRKTRYASVSFLRCWILFPVLQIFFRILLYALSAQFFFKPIPRCCSNRVVATPLRSMSWLMGSWARLRPYKCFLAYSPFTLQLGQEVNKRTRHCCR